MALARLDLESLRRQTVALWWLALFECGNRRRAEDVVYESVVSLCRQEAGGQYDPAERWSMLVIRVKSALGGSGEQGFEPPTGGANAGGTCAAADLEAVALTLAGYNGSEVAELTEVPLGEVRRRIRRGLTALGLRSGLLGVTLPEPGPQIADTAANSL
jgi:hypothetical protein